MIKISYKWIALALLWVTYFLLQGTRQIYGATLPQIKADFGTDDVQMGLVASAFFMCYAIAVPFGGLAADFLRRKWVVVVGSALFATGIFLSSFAAKTGLMVITYGILNGVGQSLVPTSSTSIIQQLHAESRATALSIYQLGLYAGIILCSVAAGYLGSLGSGGWRKAFILFGGIGLLWVIVLAVFLRNTPHADNGVKTKPSFKAALLSIFVKPSAILMTLAFGLSNFGDIGFRTWMPAFMQRTFVEMTPASAAFHSVIWFYAGGFLGILAGSRLSDKWMRSGCIGARLNCNLIGLLLCAPCAFVAVNIVDGLASMALALTVYGFVHGFYDANFIVSFYEVITPRYRTAAYGLFACGAFAIGSASPAVLGMLSSVFSFKQSLSMIGVFYLAAALLTVIARVTFLKRDYERE